MIEHATVHRPQPSFTLVDLSPRERQALDAIAAGQTAKDMARQLGVSPGTVEEYRKRAFRKIGARGSIHAVNLLRQAEIDCLKAELADLRARLQAALFTAPAEPAEAN